MTTIKNNILIFFALIILFFTISAFFVTLNAQISNNTSSVSFEIIPDNPGVFETVSLKLVSYSVDLNRAKISWFINDKLKSSEIGKIKFYFKTGDIGSSSKITVSIQSKTFSINKSIIIKPTEVDMLWEAIDSYTPPFYKGKALPSSQSVIKITALPNTSSGINPSRMIYKWKKNYKYKDLNNQSGYGKQIVVFKRNLLRENETISVEVSSLDESVKTKGRTVLSKFSPKIVFYQNNPLEGILYNNAIINNFKMNTEEIKVVAEPYFFSSKNKDISLLSYVWTLNNKEIDDTESENKNEIVLRTNGKSGASNISLSIRNLSRILQFNDNSFKVNF